MKGIFNNILLLACASVFSSAMAVPFKREAPSVSDRYVQFTIGKSGMSKDEMTKYRNEIEAVFGESESEDNRALAALYCLQELYDENESYACESNVYNRYLAESHDYSSESKEAVIKAGIAQFKYMCTEGFDGYCDVDGIKIQNKKSSFEYPCNIRTTSDCRKNYIDFVNALPSEDIKDIAVTTNYNKKVLIDVKVNAIPSKYVETVEELCEHGVKPGFSQIDDDDDDDVKISTNGKCGPKNGNTVCPSDECCSKHGYCGHSSDHCKVSRGCQSKFGLCQ